MAKSRTEAQMELWEAMIEFYRWGGGQGEIHPWVEGAYIDYRNRRAAESKEKRADESTSSE